MNRYTYAHNNPIYYVDESGNFAITTGVLLGWLSTAAVGASVGASISGGSQMLQNYLNGNEIMSGVKVAAGKGAIAGGISAFAGGYMTAMVLGGIGNLAVGVTYKEINSYQDIVYSFMTGMAAGAIGQKSQNISQQTCQQWFANMTKKNQQYILKLADVRLTNRAQNAMLKDIKKGIMESNFKSVWEHFRASVMVSGTVSSVTGEVWGAFVEYINLERTYV